jgi:hypothetical protein
MFSGFSIEVRSPMIQSIKQLTLSQQRLRLMALLEAEQVKLQALLTLIQSPLHQGPDTPAVCETLVTHQQKIIAKLEQRIQHLTDQLEGPELRDRLQITEAALKTAQVAIAALQEQLGQLESKSLQQEAAIGLLSAQVQDLQTLNDVYVKEIAALSLHERQNAEDHALTVLTISRRLSQQGLVIPAKASAQVIDREPQSTALDEGEALASNPRVDQTLFSKTFRAGYHDSILSLVVSSVTLNLDTQPIEILLTEKDRQQNRHQTRLLRGFPTCDAIPATEFFIEVYQKLSAKYAAQS